MPCARYLQYTYIGTKVDFKSYCVPLCVQAPTGPAADPSVFTHLSLAGRRDPHLWPRLCYGEYYDDDNFLAYTRE